jgi:MFS family permease
MQGSIRTKTKQVQFPLEGLSGLKVFFFFGAAYFLSYAFRAVNAVIAPELIADLGLGNTSLGLLSSAYFVGFALMQLPLGVWLDKYGSRRTESVLLLMAVFGSVLFGLAENIIFATVGRGFIGAGVSACLMASFTAYRRWYKPEQQGSLASGMLVFGTAGVLMTTIPVQAVLPYIGWRGVFFTMATLVALAAIGIRFGLPISGDPVVEKSIAPVSNEAPKSSLMSFKWLSGYGNIFKNGFFLQMLPMGIFNQGGFIAFQTLWLGPWFSHVVGFSDFQVAQALFVFNLVLLSGYLFNAWAIPRLNKIGISTFKYSGVFAGIALMVLFIAVKAGNHPYALYIWLLLGICSTSFILGQSLIQTRFPKEMAGRASTAYNLMLFVGAFTIQLGIGWLIDLFMAGGVTKSQSFTYAMYIMMLLQLVSYSWMWLAPKILKGATLKPEQQ